MEEAFAKLLDNLALSDLKETISGKLIEVIVDEDRREWFFNMELASPPSVEDFSRFETALKTMPERAACDRVDYEISYADPNTDDLIGYYRHALKSLVEQRPRYSALQNYDVANDEGKLILSCPKDGTYVETMVPEVTSKLLKIGFDVDIAIRYCEETPSITERIEKVDREEREEAERDRKQNGEARFIRYKDRGVKKIAHTIDEVPIDEASLVEYKSMHHHASFSLEATVMNVDERRLNPRTTLFTFVLSDEKDSIYVKKFVRDKEELTFLRGTEPHMVMRVEGGAQYDQYVGEVVLTAVAIERTNKPVPREMRQDNADVKRVELQLHSKMSTLDGIDAIEDYVATALRFHHPAIALTDHNSVQAFPDFYRAVKNKPIKPIYGAELSVVDEADVALAWGEADTTLREATYTVFDIETTSLSVDVGKIIEISAVKLHDHQVIDRFHALVNPGIDLPAFTKKLTGITQTDVNRADTIDAVLPTFYEFFKGTVLVAHNARFDMAHIIQNLKALDLPVEDFPVIDTLQIARQLYAGELKRFNLKAVAKHFKVELARHHRAEEDTEATANVFKTMLTRIDELGFRTFGELKNIQKHRPDIDIYANAMPFHVTVLVKNQTGLKNLYRVVTLANTDYHDKEARIPKKVLEKHREGLLIGSGCMNSRLFEMALNRSEAETEDAAKAYDFLEIQPFEDYMHMGKDIEDVESVIAETLKKIVRVGDKLRIPVVATSDAHHIEKHGVNYRDIYIQTPVVGGGYHTLEKYEKIPSQYFRTTAEMLESFPFLDAKKREEIVVKNTRAIAEKIELVEPFKKTLYAPTDDFLAQKHNVPSIEKTMREMVYRRAHELYGKTLPPLLKDRLDKEMRSITDNKFSTVYYISHLLVKKSIDSGYLVGSRGSVGSSVVATLMDITEVNPLPPHYVCPKCALTSFKMTDDEKERYGVRDDERALQLELERVASGFDLKSMPCPSCGHDLGKDGHDIPFETFLGFKGDKVPDIDLNFSGDYQPIVHEYIRDLFGKDHAFRAGTISTVADKTAFGYVKGYIEKKNLTLRKAEIDRRAKVIAGVKRSTGQHPGGIVVVPDYKDIHDVTPVQYPADDTTAKWKTTHFDYHAFEDNLFKLDVLGHDDPTMIRYLMDFVKKDPISFPFKEAKDIPLDDQKVYALLSGTEVIGLKPEDINSSVASFGVPEMGTSFVRQMLQAARPKTFADIVKVSGLSHGTDVWLNNAETLVTGKNVKFGKIPFKDVIGCRDDIMVYLIQSGLKSEVAFEISEFIRKGKAAKDPDTWEGYKMIMREHNIPEWYIWSAGQIKYMFPKAHATAYVMMALRIAWFKVHRPIYFYSAYFSKRARDFDLVAMQGGEYTIERRMNEIDDKGKAATDVERRLYTVLEVALEMVKRGFGFKPIDIMRSEARDYVITDHNSALRMPFVALDGLGLKVAESIVKAREEKMFTSREDVRERTALSSTLFDKLEALGAFGDLPESGQMTLEL